MLTATKKVYKGDDEPYSKIIFDNTQVKIIDRNGTATMMAHEFFQACQPGDLVDMKNEKDGDFWKIASLENKTRAILPEGSGQSQVQEVVAGADWNAAVGFVNVLVNNGHYKDKTSPEILLDAVVTYKLQLEELQGQTFDSEPEEYTGEM